MKISITSTSAFININGQKCRIWEGETQSGVKITAFIACVSVSNSDDQNQFDAELQERHERPVNVWPLSMFLD